MLHTVRLEVMLVLQLGVIDLYRVLLIIQTEVQVQAMTANKSLYPVIMQQKILFFVFLELCSKLSAGSLVFHLDQLPHDEFLELGKLYRALR